MTDFTLGEKSVSVATRDHEGREGRAEAELLVDASGQNSLLAGRVGMRRMDPALRNFAVFSHYEGATRYSGNREGDISVVLAPDGWWWMIPLAGDRTSVGLVAPARSLAGRKPDERYFDERIANSAFVSARLREARRVAPVRALSDWSYSATRLAGERWVLVGDAGAFVDPVFSTGVYLGMIGAFRAADSVERALRARHFGRAAFSDYERWVKRGVGQYRKFVRGFYHPAFVEVLLQPSDWLGLRSAVTSLLAGHGVDRFDVNWRVLLFRLIARANRRLRLAPRLPGRRERYAELG